MTNPYLEQLSIFIENRSGELYAITSLLEKKGISLISIMLADSSEFGILRLLTKETQQAKDILLEHGFMAQSSHVIGVRIENHVGSFNQVVKTLASASIDIRYTYTVNEKNDGLFIFKIEDTFLQKAVMLLKENHIKLITQEDL